ncbi:MAG: alpha/beta hydrolase [Alphaproteobacteria bacterium]|nr:alpha/beta hydrolase [Alphaproteobacteria bacterium]
MPEKDGRTRLGPVNRLMPKDGGTRRVLSGHGYGPHPRMRLDAYAPRRFDEPLPVLFFIYGGGWDSGHSSEYEFVGRAFARAGFITAIADYRIVPEVHYPDFLIDCGRALTEALSVLPAFGADADRVFLMGHSAGAYNAAMLGLDGTRFGAPALGERLRGVIGLSGPYDFYPFDVKQSIAAFSRAENPQASQPVNLVNRKAPAFFLGHGTDDTTCGLYNTQNLGDRLRAAGVPVFERHYEGVRHILPLLSLFPLLRWRLPVLRDVLAFMRERM